MFSSIRKILSLVFLFILGCLSVYGAYWLVTPKTVLQKLKHEGFIPLITQTVEDDEFLKRKIFRLWESKNKKENEKENKNENRIKKLEENEVFKWVLERVYLWPTSEEIQKWKQECRNLYDFSLWEKEFNQRYKLAKIACIRSNPDK